MNRFKKIGLIGLMLASSLLLIAWTTNTGSILYTGPAVFRGDVLFEQVPTFSAGILATDLVADTEGKGDVPATTGLSVVESGSQVAHKTEITLTDLTVSLTDNADTVAYLGAQIYDFPEGAVMFMGSMADITVTLSAAGVDADWAGDFSLGTATADNGAALATTEQDLLPTTATAAATSSVGTFTGQSTVANIVVFDGTSTAKDVFLNVLVDDADQDVTTTATDMIFNGTVSFTWVNLGTY